MLTRDEAEARFLEELPRLERSIAALCRRCGHRGDDADDVASWLKARLIEHDYQALRKFRGDSELATYLTTVTRMLYRDWVVQQHGRWRPSAEAQRQGTVAMQLERLVYRDGLTLANGIEQLRTMRVTDLSDRRLVAIFRSLPAREPLRPRAVDAETIDVLPDATSADDLVVREEARQHRSVADAALDGALNELETEDRVLIRLRFWEGLSIADVARALALPQKPLYRRLERLFVRLRERLVAQGVSSAAVRELLDEGDVRDPDGA